MTGTLVVAIIALVVAVVGLTWQIVQFLLAGGRVSVELRIGATNGSMVVAGTAGQVSQDFEVHARQGLDIPVLGVLVRNRGRLAVSITGWEVVFDGDGGGSISTLDWQVNAGHPLPFRLEPGAEVSWFSRLDQVAAGARALGID